MGGGWFLRLYTFSWSCRAGLSAAGLPFALPRVVLIVQLCVPSPSPAESSQLSVCAHWSSIKPCTLHPWGRTQGASYGGCVVRHMEQWTEPIDQAEGLKWGIPGLPSGVCKLVNRICILLELLWVPIPGCCAPSSPCPSVMQVTSVSWVGWETHGSLWKHLA